MRAHALSLIVGIPLFSLLTGCGGTVVQTRPLADESQTEEALQFRSDPDYATVYFVRPYNGFNFYRQDLYVAGTQLPEYPFPSPVQFQLGGPTSSIRSYAELMTSVMNPNYHISNEFRAQQRLMGEVPLDSPMPNFDHMSLAQLFDIVAFLDSKYQVIIDYE